MPGPDWTRPETPSLFPVAASSVPAGPPSAPGRRHLWLALGLCFLTAVSTFTGVAWLASRVELDAKERRIAELERIASATKRQRQKVEVRLLKTIEDLEATAEHQRELIQRLSEFQAAVRHDLDLTEQELRSVAEERDAARELAASLDSGARDQELLRRSAEKERQSLTAKLASLEARLASVAAEREVAQRTERGLRWRLEMMEAKLAEARPRPEEPPPPMARAGGRAGVVERALAKAGIDIERLLDRVGDEVADGQGGPLEPAGEIDGIAVASAEPAADLVQSAARLEAINRLIGVLPLAAPVRDYRLMSGFGVRQDPITGRRALHAGLDFTSDPEARILVPAPGRVVAAGRDGSYGLAVVIDHGLGISTRYAHLKSILVEPGQEVTPGRAIGIMGSTGRSTGRHLHYEIRIDGKAIDPMPFLEAGKQLVNVRKG